MCALVFSPRTRTPHAPCFGALAYFLLLPPPFPCLSLCLVPLIPSPDFPPSRALPPLPLSLSLPLSFSLVPFSRKAFHQFPAIVPRERVLGGERDGRRRRRSRSGQAGRRVGKVGMWGGRERGEKGVEGQRVGSETSDSRVRTIWLCASGKTRPREKGKTEKGQEERGRGRKTG